MINKVEIPAEERTEPYGTVMKMETNYKEVPEWEWHPAIKMSMPTGTYKVDPKHILADGTEYIELDKGCCRSCHQKIKPYKKRYYEKHLDYCGPHCFEYSQENDYCEECAKEKSRFAYIQDNRLTIVRTENREEFGSGEYLERNIYSDGSVVEEMTYDEKIRARV